MKVSGFNAKYDIEKDTDNFFILIRNKSHQDTHIFKMSLPAASEVSVLIERLEELTDKLKQVAGEL